MRFWLSVLLSVATAAAAAAETVLRIGTRLLPATEAAPFTSILLPSSLVHHAIYDTLTLVAPDGSVRPWLATGWRMENPTTWVFELRRDVNFSTGAPFTADAVVAAIDFLLSPAGEAESVGSQMRYNTVVGARALGPHTVEITTRQPDAILPLHMMFLRIPEPETWRRLGPLDFARAPVGTGPFVVERWRDGRVALAAHRGSWRAPQVDRIDIVMIPDQAARVQALTSGAVDIAIGLTPEEEPAIAAAGARLHVHLKPETSFLAFVSTKPGEVKDVPVKDIRVRRALNHAVNRQAIIDTILGGATAPASQISHPQAFGYNAALEPYPYDPAKAKALLAEAGFPNGFALPILLVGGFNNFDSVYQLIGIDLAAVGVKLEILRNTPAKQQEYVYQGGWPTLGFAMTSSMFDPLGGYRIRSCAWAHPYHCDPAIMPLIEAAQVAPTPELRADLTRQVMAAERDNPPGIILWQSPGFDGVARSVVGFKASEDFIPFHALALEN